MVSPIRSDPTEDSPSLAFDCGGLPVEDSVLAAGIEPSGYFWEGVLRFLDPSLSEGLEFDSESDMFCIYGDAHFLEQARAQIEPLLADSAAVTRVIERAEAVGFDLEDSEAEDPDVKQSFFRRLWRR